VNLCQHLYFNLAGAGDIRDHRFRIAAARYTPTQADGLPSGEIRAVAGSRFDLRQPRRLSEADPEGAGFDQNFVLAPARGDHAGAQGPRGGAGPDAAAPGDPASGPPLAEAWAPDGMRLRLWTDQPGLQFYTGAFLTPHATPWPGVAHGPFGGFCMEAQGFPDAVNRPGFPSVLCTPDQPYRQRTTIEIAPS
jgi:aldose 1-epimerase